LPWLLAISSRESLTLTESALRSLGQARYRADSAKNVIFRHPHEVSAAAYTEALEAFGSIMSGTYNTYLSMTNWLRLINLSNTSSEVTIDYDGNSESLTLPAHARRDITIPTESSALQRYGSFNLNTANAGVISSSVVRTRHHEDNLDFMAICPVR